MKEIRKKMDQGQFADLKFLNFLFPKIFRIQFKTIQPKSWPKFKENFNQNSREKFLTLMRNY